MAESLDIYRQRGCADRFKAITTLSDHWVGVAVEQVDNDMGGTFTGLVEQYRGRSVEDLAKDLGVSYELAESIGRVTGLI